MSRRGTRIGLFTVLLCVLPVLVWLGAELRIGPGLPGPSQPLLTAALRATWLGQMLLALLLPRDLASPGPDPGRAERQNLIAASGLLTAVPAPLWIAVAACGVVPARALVADVTAVSLFVLAAPQLLWACERGARGRLGPSRGALLMRGLEIALALGLWWLLADWKGWA